MGGEGHSHYSPLLGLDEAGENAIVGGKESDYCHSESWTVLGVLRRKCF